MTKQSYTVEIESDPLASPPTDEQLDDFSAAIFADRRLAGPVPAADLATHTLSLSTSVDAEHQPEALAIAITAFERAAARAKIPAAVSETLVMADQGEDIDVRELVSGGDVARRLGLTRERIRQLAGDPAKFPRPVAVIGRDRIWRWRDVARWAKVNDRKTKVARRRRKVKTA
jgi:hypothetical protein